MAIMNTWIHCLKSSFIYHNLQIWLCPHSGYISVKICEHIRKWLTLQEREFVFFVNPCFSLCFSLTHLTCTKSELMLCPILSNHYIYYKTNTINNNKNKKSEKHTCLTKLLGELKQKLLLQKHYLDKNKPLSCFLSRPDKLT